MTEYILINSADEYRIAAGLFKEYADDIGIDLSFQHFEEELQELPIMYGESDGGIILCKKDGEYVGCVGIRKQEEGIAELKRMFVRPGLQGSGIGRQLMNEAIQLAERLGYLAIRLDTLNYMHNAMKLYRDAGFHEIPAYYHNPNETAVFFQLPLTQ